MDFPWLKSVNLGADFKLAIFTCSGTINSCTVSNKRQSRYLICLSPQRLALPIPPVVFHQLLQLNDLVVILG